MEKEIIGLSAKIDPEVFKEFRKLMIDLDKNSQDVIATLIENFVQEHK